MVLRNAAGNVITPGSFSVFTGLFRIFINSHDHSPHFSVQPVLHRLPSFIFSAFSKIQLPTYVVAGGNGGNGNTAMDAMGLKMMTDLVNQMSK